VSILVEQIVTWVGSYKSFVILMIGCSGSGKSTLAQSLSLALRANIISSDEIRGILSPDGDDRCNLYEQEVWQRVYHEVGLAVSMGQRIIVDATHAKQPDRIRMINHVRHFDFQMPVLGIWMDIPLHFCMERDANRDFPRRDGVSITYRHLNIRRHFTRGYPPSIPTLHFDRFDGLFRVSKDDQVL
jgi:predicted kinase